MSVFLVVEGNKIKLEPNSDWKWQGFNGEISLKGTKSLLSVEKKRVIIKTDFPQTHNLGKSYSTQTHSTQGTIKSVLLSVDDKTLSTQIFSKEACVTEKTSGSFQAVVSQPASTPNNVLDPVSPKQGQWHVVESGQEIMAVEATAPQSLFLNVESTSIPPVSQNKQVVAKKTTTDTDDNQEETVEVELFFCYQDGTPICQAPYKIIDSQGQEFIGSFSDKGVACLTVRAGRIEIECGEDIRDYKPNRQPQPNPKYAPDLTTKQIFQKEPIKDKGIWEVAYDDVTDSIIFGFGWVGGVLQGDFNKDPTNVQIITNTIITMIPVLDQIGDFRDLSANIITLIEEKGGWENWLTLSITLIGLIPTFGSALKGIFKYLLKNMGKITKSKLLAVSRLLGKGNSEKFLKQLDWEYLTKTSIDTFEEVIDKTKTVIQHLDDLAGLLSEQYAKALSKKLNNLLDSLESIKLMSKDELKKAMDWYRKRIDDLIGEKVKRTVYSAIAKKVVSKIKIETDELESSD